MANIKSQIKRNRQNDDARMRNKAVRSALRTSTRKARIAAESGSDDAETLLRDAARDLDKAASKGVVHKKAAARKKSRMARAAAAS